MSQPLHRESVVVSAGRPDRTPDAPLSYPLVLSAPFHHAADDNRYARSASTDTIRGFEDAMAQLEGGPAVAFASGMAAIAAIVEGLPTNSVVVTPATSYSGTATIFAEQERLGRLSVREVDQSDTAAVIAALDGADLLWIESPSNPLLDVADVPALIAAGRAAEATVCVDSTFNTPIVFRPLEHGADLVMHSATKYLSGHSDVLLGVLISATAEQDAAVRARRSLTGGVPGALEAYLALRGLRTLALRMERSQANAMTLAGRLSEHPAVTRVRYPGLPTDPWHDRATRTADGFGAMISFEVAGSLDAAEQLCERVRLITHATSLGGVETLIERRARHTIDARRGTPPTLLRLSVGIEHVEDLWADLDHALGSLG
jgi:cystathionine gamma-synthase